MIIYSIIVKPCIFYDDHILDLHHIMAMGDQLMDFWFKKTLDLVKITNYNGMYKALDEGRQRYGNIILISLKLNEN